MGYIQTDSEIDFMYEQESENMWERMQPPPMEEKDYYKRFSFETLNEAWAHAETIIRDFDAIEEYLGKTFDLITGTPEYDKLASIIDEVSDLKYEVKQIVKKLHAESHRAFDREWD